MEVYDKWVLGIDGLTEEQKQQYHAHLGIEYRSPDTFLVSSKNEERGHGPYIVTHDGMTPTRCTCPWYVHRVGQALLNNEEPVKYCGHFMRAFLVLIRLEIKKAKRQIQGEPFVVTAVKQKDDDDTHGHLHGSQPFNLFK